MIGKPKPKPKEKEKAPGNGGVAKKPPVKTSSKTAPVEPTTDAKTPLLATKKPAMAGIGGGIKLGGGVKAKLLAKKLKIATPEKEKEPEPEPEAEVKAKPVKMDMSLML
jgi:hypothetical protein